MIWDFANEGFHQKWNKDNHQKFGKTVSHLSYHSSWVIGLVVWFLLRVQEVASSILASPLFCSANASEAKKRGVMRESNSRPLAPKARIIPLDQSPDWLKHSGDLCLKHFFQKQIPHRMQLVSEDVFMLDFSKRKKNKKINKTVAVFFFFFFPSKSTARGSNPRPIH
jgi:hypothetical protein